MYKHIVPAKHDGSTYHSVRAMDNHLDKIGQVMTMVGYLVRRRGHVQHRVMVTGVNGKIRFGGLNWGYHGEGSRALIQLIIKLGAYEDDATTFVESLKTSKLAKRKTRQQKWKLSI